MIELNITVEMAKAYMNCAEYITEEPVRWEMGLLPKVRDELLRMGSLRDLEQAVIDRYFRAFDALERIIKEPHKRLRLSPENLIDLRGAVLWATGLHFQWCSANLYRRPDEVENAVREMFHLVELQKVIYAALYPQGEPNADH